MPVNDSWSILQHDVFVDERQAPPHKKAGVIDLKFCAKECIVLLLLYSLPNIPGLQRDVVGISKAKQNTSRPSFRLPHNGIVPPPAL